MIFIPSVGPGYDDTMIRPWNRHNFKSRRNGQYYEKMFSSAVSIAPPIISITSFNEWHEGTQIEPADDQPPQPSQGSYTGYEQGPFQYYEQTKYWTQRFIPVATKK
mmetsp:Transcript_6714/g.8964  ORF Transcript_6714/g.8964 Transcript_6714/m.8964 type:complete len:106 (+) Transcript_6714:508-825(+)